MNKHEPRSPGASTSEANANAPSRPSPPSSSAPTQVQRPPAPDAAPHGKQPPPSSAATRILKPGARDALGEAPTILYTPHDPRGGAPDPAPRILVPGPSAGAPAPAGRGGIDEPTVRMPPGVAPAGAGLDEPTLKRPERRAPAGAEPDEPTLKRTERPERRAPAGAEPDEPTLKRPERRAPAGAEPDEPTIKRPERRAPAGAEPDEPTLKRTAPADEDGPTLKAEPRTPFGSARDDEEGEPEDLRAAARAFLKRHGKKLWWLHTAYALALGAFVVTFAQKGFQHARWLAISVSVAWLLVVLFFRLFGTGARQDYATAWRGARLRFTVMTYVLKNLYQGMLFFLLPFYWKSASLDAPNRWFVLLLGGCAVLSTLDLVFDRVLMRWKTLASMFYGVTLFACLNLVIPALFPDTRTLYTLLSAAVVSVLAFCTMHIPLSALASKAGALFVVVATAGGAGLAYGTREIIPPVPMHLSSAAVGPMVLPDGRLAMEVKSLHASVIQQLLAVTDVVVPGGRGDRLHHVWRHEGREIYRAPEEMLRVPGPEGAVRLKSQLAGGRLPRRLLGHWAVDVETEDGQLVGRTSFEVTE